MANENMIQKHLDNFLAKIAGETPIDDNPRNSTEFWLDQIGKGIPISLIVDADGHKRFQTFTPESASVVPGVTSIATLSGNLLTIVGVMVPGTYGGQSVMCKYRMPHWIMEKIYNWSESSTFVRSFYTRIRVFYNHETDITVNMALLKNYNDTDTLSVYLENASITAPEGQPISFEITLVID